MGKADGKTRFVPIGLVNVFKADFKGWEWILPIAESKDFPLHNNEPTNGLINFFVVYGLNHLLKTTLSSSTKH